MNLLDAGYKASCLGVNPLLGPKPVKPRACTPGPALSSFGWGYLPLSGCVDIIKIAPAQWAEPAALNEISFGFPLDKTDRAA